jgi:hypothetical protein
MKEEKYSKKFLRILARYRRWAGQRGKQQEPPARVYPWLAKFAILLTFTVLGYRVGRQARRVRYENERAASKVVPPLPQAGGKGLGAVLKNPATVAVLTAVLAALTFVLVVLTAWLVVLATAHEPRVARPAYRWA